MSDNSLEQLQDEALAWVARLRSDCLSEEDKQQFSLWLNQSDQHERVFDEAMNLWQDLGAVQYVQEAAPEKKPEPSKRYLGWGLAIAASVALFAVFLTMPSFRAESPSDSLAIVEVLSYRTHVGEQKRISLPDGSVVELNTNSKIEVRYSVNERRVVLVEGEAHFDVLKDASRPFLVDIGDGTVVAVGTAFNIRKNSDGAIVTVTEGKVKVAQNGEPSQEKFLSMRHQVELRPSGLGNVTTLGFDEAVAWRSKTVVFQKTDLSMAVAEINRYLSRPVKLDESLRESQLRVSGTFSLEAPEATLDAIVAAFNLSKVDTGSSLELQAKPSS
jgi:transmembrane sensor